MKTDWSFTGNLQAITLVLMRLLAQHFNSLVH